MLQFWDTVKLVFSGMLVLCVKEYSKTRQAIPACPEQCVCYQPWFDQTVAVNCTARNLTAMPAELPTESREIDFSNNMLTVIGPNVFDGLEMLGTVNLTNNLIQSVSEDAFSVKATQSDFNTLDLSRNKLNSAPKKLPPNLEYLTLGNNLISDITYQSFEGQTQLKNLYLHNNKIQKLHTYSFSSEDRTHLTGLQVLHLENNGISFIDGNTFKNLTSLRQLCLAYNRITKLTINVFSGLKHLHALDLRYNFIVDINPNTFIALDALIYLHLSHNNLTALPKKLPMLEWFDISHNFIETISEDFNSVLYPVDIFILANNPLKCDCDMLWVKELYDTREYQFKYLEGDKVQYIPSCNSPPFLEGEFWDVLGDDVFQCPGRSKSKKQFYHDNNVDLVSEKNEEHTKLENIDLKVQTFERTSNSLKVGWQLSQKVSNGYMLQYYPVGKRMDHIDIDVNSNTDNFNITELMPDTKYIICVIPKISQQHTLDFQNCVETRTDTIQKSWMSQFYLLKLLTFSLITGGVILLLAVICGSFVIMGSIWSLKKRDLSGGYKASYELKSPKKSS